jgi:hypothetical protein
MGGTRLLSTVLMRRIMLESEFSRICDSRCIFADIPFFFSIFGTLGGESDFGPAAYSNAVTKRSFGKRNAPVRVL